jgi:chemotaxis protein CheC
MNPTPNQLEALREMINIGIGRGAGVLNTMLQSHISLQAPAVKMMTHSELPRLLDIEETKLCMVVMPFNGPLEGDSAMIFPFHGAERLVGCLTDRDVSSATMDTLEAGTLCEIGNIVLNGVMGTISNILGLNLIYQVPSFRQGEIGLVRPCPSKGSFVTLLARTCFEVEETRTEGFFTLFFEERSFVGLMERIDALIMEEA